MQNNPYFDTTQTQILSYWDSLGFLEKPLFKGQDFLSSIYFILFPFYSHQFYLFPTPKIVNISQREHRFSFSWLWVSGSGIKILISIDFLTKERNIGCYIARCQKSEKTGLKLVENCILILTSSLLERLKHMGFYKVSGKFVEVGMGDWCYKILDNSLCNAWDKLSNCFFRFCYLFF